ncbi:MAG: hypothetical protein KatS3mg105_1164 [Gemmatales bacterium]|nr:MAG: hypothetical protein KatS3mg105_1164 [Gemmatales bacterium]
MEGRGNYYDRSGVLRDMIQNHMFQMLAYLCMEPPSSFKADAIRNEKAKVLEAIRIYSPEEVLTHTVRGQYGPGKKPNGEPAVGYRQEPDVNPESQTETFAAMKLYIDNWRWDGVPIYLRSGKALWKRGTEIVVCFRRAPQVIFRGTPAAAFLDNNQLIFHIQPDQGIELRFQAKTPGPSMLLQKVNMRFNYGEAFSAVRGTGYEVLLYQCMIGDATLFSPYRPGRNRLARRPAYSRCLESQPGQRLSQLSFRVVGTQSRLRLHRSGWPTLDRDRQPGNPRKSSPLRRLRCDLPQLHSHDAQNRPSIQPATSSSRKAKPAKRCISSIAASLRSSMITARLSALFAKGTCSAKWLC